MKQPRYRVVKPHPRNPWLLVVVIGIIIAGIVAFVTWWQGTH